MIDTFFQYQKIIFDYNLTWYTDQTFLSRWKILKTLVLQLEIKKHNNQILTNAFQYLFRIEPDVFEELVLDGFVSITLI